MYILVVFIEECPSIDFKTKGSPPALIKLDENECRRL